MSQSATNAIKEQPHTTVGLAMASVTHDTNQEVETRNLGPVCNQLWSPYYYFTIHHAIKIRALYTT